MLTAKDAMCAKAETPAMAGAAASQAVSLALVAAVFPNKPVVSN
jgi:hypothetical protein